MPQGEEGEPRAASRRRWAVLPLAMVGILPLRLGAAQAIFLQRCTKHIGARIITALAGRLVASRTSYCLLRRQRPKATNAGLRFQAFRATAVDV
jgi:hypothetical protein